MRSRESFFNLYTHNFIRVAVAIPEVRVADPGFNAAQTVALMQRAADQHAALAVFPELGLSAYSCEDLFQQQALLDGCRAALGGVVAASLDLPLVIVVGLPLQIDSLLFNCAAVVQRGRILGVVPKTYLPNYREFYELRQFVPGDAARREMIELLDQHDIPFGNRLLFQADNHPSVVIHLEICEDLWVPIPPSSYAALAGATILINLSASNSTIGKADYRRQLVASQSSRGLAAYLYSAAGCGESTTDLAWDGHGMIYENGTPLAETIRFAEGPQLITGDVDLDRLAQDRMRQTSFGQAVLRHRDSLAGFRTIRFAADLPREGRLPLARRYERFPYVPSDPMQRDERCREVKVVIGVSGGLDSTQALLVCAQAMDRLKRPRSHILAYTMPGFATSARTLYQALRLIKAVGCAGQEIDIKPSCLRMFQDIGHPYAQGKPVYYVTFEHVQAGERTSHLFRLANQHGGLVVGTSDLSELALGWCTYGVGDQMSHYSVNASVPKTLIAHLVRWASRRSRPDVADVLHSIL